MTTLKRLLRIGMTVSDLRRISCFYQDDLGFTADGEEDADAACCALFGVRAMRRQVLHWGAQQVELTQCDPPGAPYPRDSTAADLVFQHFAVRVGDIGAAYRRLIAGTAISRHGPVTLPKSSGGVTAFKFRDPDGHPIELIAFPQTRPDGIDHSAIAVADGDASIRHYQSLGLRVTARQCNFGPEQDALDGLDAVAVGVVALSPPEPTPHLELLAYRNPRGRPAGAAAPNDIAATRLVMAADVAAAAWQHDPDLHAMLLLPGD